MATIYQRGDGWRVSIRMKGVSISRTLDTEEAAKAWAAREEDRIKAGGVATDVAAAAAPVCVTMADLFDRYAAEVSEHRKGRLVDLIRFRALKRYPLFHRPIAEITGELAEQWRDERLKHVCGSTVCRELAMISGVFTHAKKRWRIRLGTNPYTDFKWPQANKPRTRRVTDAECEAIAAALGWDGISTPVTSKHYTAWCHAFAIQTMMRSGEILGLRWKHVHARHCHLDKTKNGDERDVPLSARALALLAVLPPGIPDERIVKVSESSRIHQFTAAVRLAKLTDCHFHDSRAEGISRSVPKIKNVMDLAKITGHRTIKVLMNTYYRPTQDYLADLLDG